ETSFTDVTGLTPGATVEYVVSAGNPGGTTVTEPESFLIPASVCTTESPVPPGPTGELAALAQCDAGAAIQVSWKAVSGAETLVLERDHVLLAELPGSETGHVDSGVEVAGSYTYVLKA